MTSAGAGPDVGPPSFGRIRAIAWRSSSGSTSRSSVIGWLAGSTFSFGKTCSIADQPASLGRLTPRIDRRQAMMRSQGGELHPMTDKRNIVINYEAIDPLLRHLAKAASISRLLPAVKMSSGRPIVAAQAGVAGDALGHCVCVVVGAEAHQPGQSDLRHQGGHRS
jgi:hypothetical protein